MKVIKCVLNVLLNVLGIVIQKEAYKGSDTIYKCKRLWARARQKAQQVKSFPYNHKVKSLDPQNLNKNG